MFIRERVKKNKGYKKRYIYHYLIESYRNQDGKPRQRTLLALGKLPLEKHYWKALANRIEEIVSNQERLIECSPDIERLAQHYASLLIEKRSGAQSTQRISEPDYEEVDLNSCAQTHVRTIGAENAAWGMVQRLGLEDIFRECCGIEGLDIITACILTAARMVYPASELATYRWLTSVSGLCELAGTEMEHISLSRLYRVSDRIYKKRDRIEEALRSKEQELFYSGDRIYLYDLTNTYFEGSMGTSMIKRYGRSKEKRTDCPLIALGVVYSRSGFPLRSRVFRGNITDAETLAEMVNTLSKEGSADHDGPPTVVLDAGISTEDNLTMLREKGYEYICVARNKPLDRDQIDLDALITVRHTHDNLVEALLHKDDEENILFCRSRKRGLKEQSIKTRFVKRFEQELEHIRNGLSKKYCTKRVNKVHERIGRIRQKYSRVARFYRIEVETEGDLAVDITWEQEDRETMDERFSGTYFLRTSRTDLNEKELWETYILLTDAEDGFRSLKSELGLRPNFHQCDRRIKAHTFITMLAFHGVQTMQWHLHKNDIYMRWETIRDLLCSQVRSTTRMTTRENRTVYIRNTSEPEDFHRIIANALDIESKPLRRDKRKT